MFIEKEYQVKDVVKKFGITRDTIKYYERQGLIEPKRSENGYRVFDEFNVQKLKNILNFRDLGFSVETILEIQKNNNSEHYIEILEEQRKIIEEQIRELNRHLTQIQKLESIRGNDMRFRNTFAVDYNLKFCIACPVMRAADRRKHFTRDAVLLTVGKDGSILDRQECDVIRENSIMGEKCRNCTRTKWWYERVYRGLVIYRGTEDMKKTLQEAKQKGESLGYHLGTNILLLKKIMKFDGVEHLTIDIIIPILQ